MCTYVHITPTFIYGSLNAVHSSSPFKATKVAINSSGMISSGADLVNVLCSGPSETAGVIAAENIEGRVIWVGPRGANHFHEH